MTYKDTPEQQLLAVKRMKKRDPSLRFDKCPVCHTWAVLMPGYEGMHVWCFVNSKKKRSNKNNLNKDQGKLFIPDDA